MEILSLKLYFSLFHFHLPQFCYSEYQHYFKLCCFLLQWLIHCSFRNNISLNTLDLIYTYHYIDQVLFFWRWKSTSCQWPWVVFQLECRERSRGKEAKPFNTSVPTQAFTKGKGFPGKDLFSFITPCPKSDSMYQISRQEEIPRGQKDNLLLRTDTKVKLCSKIIFCH